MRYKCIIKFELEICNGYANDRKILDVIDITKIITIFRVNGIFYVVDDKIIIAILKIDKWK